MRPYTPTDMRWKICPDCGKRKERLISFKPRFTRCAAHRAAHQPHDPACAECTAVIHSNIRQPRCHECDLQRDHRGQRLRVRSQRTSVCDALRTSPSHRSRSRDSRVM